jgi:chromosome segregation ATPase
MSFHFKTRHWLLAIIPVGIAVITIAWQNAGKENTNNDHQKQDTVPSKHHHHNEFDEMRDEKDLDKAMLKLDEALKHINNKMENIDWRKIEDQIRSSMDKVNEEMKDHEVDMEKVQRQLDDAMKNIDFEKISKETARAMQHLNENIDINKINEEVHRGLEAAKEQMNSKEFRESMDAAKKINMDEVSKALKNVKEEMEKNKFDLNEQMDNAKEGIEKAKEELKDYRELIDGLEKDGLINTKEDYSIKYKDDELYLNGKKQSPEITEKYKGYFKENNTRIYKKNGRFTIDTD